MWRNNQINFIKIESQSFTFYGSTDNKEIKLQIQYHPMNDYIKYFSEFTYKSLPENIKFWFHTLEDVANHFKKPKNFVIHAGDGQIQIITYLFEDTQEKLGSTKIELEKKPVSECQKTKRILQKLTKIIFNQRKEFLQFKNMMMKNQNQIRNKLYQTNQQLLKLKQTVRNLQIENPINNIISTRPSILTSFSSKEKNHFKTNNSKRSKSKSLTHISTPKNYNKSFSKQKKLVNQRLKQQPKLRFVKQNMHQDFEIIQPYSIKSAQNSNKLALIEPEISNRQNVYHLKFIILKLSDSIGFGICNKDIVKENKFKFIPQKFENHGTFMMMKNGKTYSNIPEDFNASTNFPEFKRCQVITVTANFEKKCVTFQRQLIRYTMPFKDIPKSKLAFCVYMKNSKGSVRIAKN